MTRIQIDVVGSLYATVPTTAPEGFVPELRPGWHVNTTHPVPGWEPYRVTPDTPRQVWGGGLVTVFYVFPGKEAFAASLDVADLSMPPPVPQEVAALQALLALDEAGLSAAYDAWASDPARTFAQRAFIARATVWRRDDTTLLAAAADLGLTSDDLDKLFRLAAELPQ